MNPAPPAPTARNPGPSWGFRFLRVTDRVLPEWIFRPLRAIGTAIALAAMPAQRRSSRLHLTAALGRPPRLRELFRHFFTFEEVMMLTLRVADGRPHRARLAPDAHDFAAFMDSGAPALLGTFHLGHSDLAGFLLAREKQRPIYMLRQRVANSHDTDRLEAAFGRWLRILWVNDPANLLFALKDAVASGASIAMKCDRVGHSSRTADFDFLGARRPFPFTIYHLALIFDRPVLLSYGVPDAAGTTVIHSSPRWAPDRTLSRTENLAAAHAHFQAFLDRVSALLRATPYWWFNYGPPPPPAAP